MIEEKILRFRVFTKVNHKDYAIAGYTLNSSFNKLDDAIDHANTEFNHDNYSVKVKDSQDTKYPTKFLINYNEIFITKVAQ